MIICPGVSRVLSLIRQSLVFSIGQMIQHLCLASLLVAHVIGELLGPSCVALKCILVITAYVRQWKDTPSRSWGVGGISVFLHL